jgi:hypothetical protein
MQKNEIANLKHEGEFSPLSKTDTETPLKTDSSPILTGVLSSAEKGVIKTGPFKPKLNRTKVLCDWLQIWCIGDLKTDTKLYKIEKQKYGNPTFTDIYVIHSVLLNCECATLACNPRSAIIDKRGALLKLKNTMLYAMDYCQLINDLLQELGYTFKSVSRLDLAVDFNSFEGFNWHRIEPEHLIRKYARGEYTKVGRNKGNMFVENNIYQYLRFGTSNSDISCYLYNKTVELQQKVMKHYIIEQWEMSDIDTKKDVWRLEISIKGNSWKYTDPDTGEIRPLTIDDLKDIAFLEGAYFFHLNKQFDIRIVADNTRHDRLKKIPLFKEKYEHKPFVLSNLTKDGTRMDKIFIRMSENYNKIQRQNKQLYKLEADYLTREYAEKTGLTEFYNKIKLPENQPVI